MLLTKVKITNYLSINGECEVPLDPRVTVLLGANDHGKSNILRSLEHLNFDNPITSDDQNWDTPKARLDFFFEVNDAEKLEVLDAKQQYARELAEYDSKQSVGEPKDAITDPVDEDEEDESEAISVAPAISPVTLNAATKPTMSSPVPRVTASTYDEDEDDADMPMLSQRTREDIESDIVYLDKIISNLPSVILTRDGVNAPLTLEGRSVEDLDGTLAICIATMIPRVELFKSFSGDLQDSVTAAEIAKDEAEFLQGIFFYAGLDPLNCESLFIHDDETDKTLEEASSQLDHAIRQRWAQGVDLDLHFQLKHRGSASIELLVEDPAVRRRKARMSKRSAGVTQFFRLSMVLHARRMKNPANSYIYVFDEPGVFLHPKGQKDLLSVFEQLAQATQIIYATHSLFMLNQNFPERHRLITKNSKSTVVDAKPYRANWKYAVDALGVRLTANILFSPNILLVEGDSDPIYIYEIMRILNHRGLVDGDANLLGIMSYGDLPNLRYLMQIFRGESSERLLVVLFDGDSQGKQYQKDVAPLMKRLEVKYLYLEPNSAIEDYCLSESLFLEAVEMTLKTSFEAMDKKIPQDLSEQIRKSFAGYIQNRSKGTSKEKKQVEANVSETVISAENAENAGAWFKNFSKEVSGNGSSKVALARNYAFLSRDKGTDEVTEARRLQTAKNFIAQLIEGLALPSQRAKSEIES